MPGHGRTMQPDIALEPSARASERLIVLRKRRNGRGGEGASLLGASNVAKDMEIGVSPDAGNLHVRFDERDSETER
jgi:hypothetical protein